MAAENPQTWRWHGNYLTCSLLSAWPHGFFTRQHGGALPDVLQTHFYPSGRAWRAKQVHGSRILARDEFATAPEFPEADGIWLDRADFPSSAWVCTADCVPVLIGDRGTGSVAAIHAGWRGTAGGIVAAAIARFEARGSRLGDLRVALGPAISGEVYQVTTEVADRVLAILQTPAGHLPDPEPGRCRLDLRVVQRQQLLELGLHPDQIAVAPYCTMQDGDRFFSYRRLCQENPSLSGRSPRVQWSGIATAR